MTQAGKIVLFRFPQTDLSQGKLRPALVLGKLPGKFDDWLVCMISTQTHQQRAGFDEFIQVDDTDFKSSGLKEASVIRVGRLAVVDVSVFVGSIGNISADRLVRIKSRLANWLLQS